MQYLCILLLTFIFKPISVNANNISVTIFGPTFQGLNNLPVQYFFIQLLDHVGNNLTLAEADTDLFKINITGSCRLKPELISVLDGLYIVRFRIFEVCRSVQVSILYNEQHLGMSPYKILNNIYPEKCYCPKKNFKEALLSYKCPHINKRIDEALQIFPQINFKEVRRKILDKFKNSNSASICHYTIKENQIYRKCEGKYTGFKMFMDGILLSLTRKAILLDTTFFVNLGDWPLMKLKDEALPVFSWCSSEDSYDIPLPTYDLTESTLLSMHRVSLDVLTTQKIKWNWNDKIAKAFWRGRDSRRERLNLVGLSQKHPDLFNASITNFFFFTDLENIYGPRQPHISLLDFFEYKYQINIDGTVAAFRLAYLLGGNSVVFKQSSPFYEHFYKDLEEFVHYIPFKRDLSDLMAQIQWAKNNDQKVQKIIKNARQFVRDNLFPTNIFCYYFLILQEYTKRLVNNVNILPEMEHVTDDSITDCNCENSLKNKDEL